ncbi:PEP/pyruvate-binding domain-containing protein [Magnetococcales bacterium HHB-1]
MSSSLLSENQNTDSQLSLESDALRANLQETAVKNLTIDPRFDHLRQVVHRYAGIRRELDGLLRELNHPYRNWKLILPELRRFIMNRRSLALFLKEGPESLLLFSDLLLEALGENQKSLEQQHNVSELLCSYLFAVCRQLSEKQLPPFIPALDQIIRQIYQLPDPLFLRFFQTHQPLSRMLHLLATRFKKSVQQSNWDTVTQRLIMVRGLSLGYHYWLSQPDPEQFLKPCAPAFEKITHRTLEQHLRKTQKLEGQATTSVMDHGLQLEILCQLFKMPTFSDIVSSYRQAANELDLDTSRRYLKDVENSTEVALVAERNHAGHKLTFMFHILETGGLFLIHEDILREINRNLIYLVRLRQEFDALERFLIKTFNFLKANVVKYPRTALQCIEVLGDEIFKRQSGPLIESFLHQTVRFGFQHSAVIGVNEQWQPICNPAHLFNIRTWLNLISLHPWWHATLLSALIINIRLTGTCIRDKDLFQKEVTQLLNSDIEPVYNLVKQFTRLLPVYFNEIGAEGELRTVSTELDELTHRKDRLIHFLRKQCHVESSNLIVDMIRATLQFWYDRDLNHLHCFIPQTLIPEIQPDGPYVLGVHQAINLLMDHNQLEEVSELLSYDIDALQDCLKSNPHLSKQDKRRTILMIRFYQLLHSKYNFGFSGLEQPLQAMLDRNIVAVRPLFNLIQGQTMQEIPQDNLLKALLTALKGLKKVILSQQQFEAQETLIQKRHIAADIPSVYGFYQELKFDALSLTFRLEQLTLTLLESLKTRIPKDFITRGALFKVVKYVNFFLRALALDGISPGKLKNLKRILKRSLQHNPLTFHQYLDIFRSFSAAVRDVINTYYVSHHRNNLAEILPGLNHRLLLPRFRNLVDGDAAQSLQRIEEAFLRDSLAESFALQTFDNFLVTLQQTLTQQEDKLAPRVLNHLMAYDPAKLFCNIHEAQPRIRDLIHLGNKGFHLVRLVECEAPVPVGVILTTEYYRCRDIVRSYPPATKDYKTQLREQIHYIERASGQTFGDPKQPLLLSVRSGALVSMPGMMQTVHNVGLNRRIVEGLAEISGNRFFAWDNYRRFIQSWSMAFGVERQLFSEIIHRAKKTHQVQLKSQFSSKQMKAIALAYEEEAKRHKIIVPEDPWQQLELAIGQVIHSWNSPKARVYRKIMDLSHNWGTAVVIQNMVFGNVTEQAGTGVLFTGHPFRKRNRVVLWGDYSLGNQGEDVVGGLVATRPISVEQCHYDRRDPETCLENLYPEIYEALLIFVRDLIYTRRWHPQEIEFTFDGPEKANLFLLQTRDMVAATGRGSVINTFVDHPDLAESRLVRGVGVFGGALCGVAVFNLAQIKQIRREESEVPLILIRYDTVPDDIKEISLTDGLLTARGGQTSHAAVVAANLEKVCVVGCEALHIREVPGICQIGDETIRFGDTIGIDGRTGWMLKGEHAIETNVIADKPLSF